MALKGTLKDFGIADILQLIGQQQKTGHLKLTARDQEVLVAFQAGTIVRAESSTRNQKDLIGTMLVRAGLITEAHLNFALETQKRTLQRLGDVLTGAGHITPEKFRQMVQLQNSETLYRLFNWKTGSYEFEQAEVEVDPAFTPLRAESVLMEGFRMVDEWPVVKRKISGYTMTFERLKELPPPMVKADAFDAALDSALAGAEAEKPRDTSGVGEYERAVFVLATPGRTVRKIIDLSQLGEFETCKTLSNLVGLGYLKGVAPVGEIEEFDQIASWGEKISGWLGRVVMTMVVLGALILLGQRIDLGALRLGAGSAASYTDPAAQRFISSQQLARLEAALQLYRLEKGDVPDKLEALVESGLVEPDDLHYPWRDPYYYRRTQKHAFVLLPPLR